MDESRQCTARLSDGSGTRCRKPAIKGGTVCASHGGGAPAVKRAARLRLLDLVDPALGTFARVMENPIAKDADKLRAAENVLDRVGIPRRVENVDVDTARDYLAEKLLELQHANHTSTDDDPDADDDDDAADDDGVAAPADHDGPESTNHK